MWGAMRVGGGILRVRCGTLRARDARFDEVLNNFADAAEGLARLAVLDGSLPAVVCDFDELPPRLVHVAHQERLRAVAMVAANVACDVEVDDVAVLQNSRIRNPMADDLVDRRAA